MAVIFDYLTITLLTWALYYPITLGGLALVLLSVMFVLFVLTAFSWHRYS